MHASTHIHIEDLLKGKKNVYCYKKFADYFQTSVVKNFYKDKCFGKTSIAAV